MRGSKATAGDSLENPTDKQRRLQAAATTECLVAGGVIAEGASYYHGIQELAAGADFGQHGIVLQRVGINGGCAVEILALAEDGVPPTLQIGLFATEELKGVAVVLSGSGDFGLGEIRLGLVAISGGPCVADSQSMTDHGGDGPAPLPHIR